MKKFILKTSILVIGLLSLLTPRSTNAQGVFKGGSFEYHVMESTPVNHLSAGKIMGIADHDKYKIVSVQIKEGKLPEGIAMFDDGTMAVKQENESLSPGKYQIKAEFIDEQGSRFTKKIKFEIVKASQTDTEASIRIAKPKTTNPKFEHHYQAGDVVAQFRDPDGLITEAKLIKGFVPPGLMFVQNKNFVVTQPELLKTGEYFCLFFLKDEKGGNSVLAISLPIGIQEEHDRKGETDYMTTIDE